MVILDPFFQKYKYFQSCYVSHYFVQYKHVNYHKFREIPDFRSRKSFPHDLSNFKSFPRFFIINRKPFFQTNF